MASELPYLPSYKNVGELFSRISTAKVPETFTQKFLANTIGIAASGDRPLINLLKQLKFLDGSGKPTAKYSALKNDVLASIEIADGIRIAYKPLFDANENAHVLPPSDLKGLVAQISGADTGTTTKILGTLNALIKVADFKSQVQENENVVEEENIQVKGVSLPAKGDLPSKGLRPEFHYNIQVHLPSNGTEETYMHIFNAIRKVFE